MHSKSNNMEVITCDNAHEVVKEIFESLLSTYQTDLERSMKESDFIFDSIQMLYYKCHKINFKHGGSYRESPDSTGNKKATINLENKDNRCFQYATTVALNLDKIEKDPQRVSNLKTFINKYNWDGIKYPSKIDNWITVKKNNTAIALNILCITEMEICPAYISKINLNCEKQIILLMIPNDEKEGWHYLTVK